MESNLGKLKQLAGQTMVYGLGTMLPRLLNFGILTPYYTRIFDKGQYGIITELYAYIVVLQVLLTYGMETGFFRFSADDKRNNIIYSTIQTCVLFTSLLFIVLSFLFNSKISTALGYESRPELISWMSIIVAVDAFTAIPFAKLRFQNKALKFSIIKIINVLTTIILVFLFLSIFPFIQKQYPNSSVLKLYNPSFGVGYVFISNLIASLLMVFLLWREIVDSKIFIDWKLLRKIIGYSLPILLAGLGGSITEALDRILLKHLIVGKAFAMQQLGVYGANFKIAVIMTLFIQMFRYASEPFFFSNMHEKNAKNLYADVMKYFVIACMFIFLVIMMYLNIIKYFIGSKFFEGLKIVPIVMIGYILLGIFFNLSISYKLSNKTMIGAYLTMIGALVTIIGNVLLVPLIGYVGSAWTHVIAYSIMILLCYIWGKKNYNVPYAWKEIFFYMISAVLLLLVSKGIALINHSYWFIWNTILLGLFIVLVLFREPELKLQLQWIIKGKKE